MILTALGWMAALLFLAGAVSAARGARRDGEPGLWAVACGYASAAALVLVILGALPSVPALVTAAAGLAAAGWLGVAETRRAVEAASGPDGWTPDVAWYAANLRAYLMGGFRYLRHDLGSLRRHLDAEPALAGVPRPAARDAAAAASARAIPSVMDDPFLGPPPEPAELATAAVPVPAAWAALAAYIGSREPADDQELRMFSDGDTAGALAVADAYHAYADTCLNGLGLSPAYVAGILEAGDSAAGHASVIAQVHKRFAVIYGAVKEWIGAHGPLPHKARDFLTGL